MSSSHHDDHHSTEAKPVSFTVPFILASVLLIIIFMFLSLCDPTHHGPNGEGHGYQGAVEAQHQAAAAAAEESHEAAQEAAAAKDSATAAPAIAPEVEGKPAETAHH